MSYTTKIVRANDTADQYMLGVRLGYICITLGVPVSAVTEELSVTKSTVYDWFSGRADVSKHLKAAVEAYSLRLAAPYPNLFS